MQALHAKKAEGASQNHGGQEINIAVRLGRNASYVTATNHSEIRLYHFNNTMPNFYTAISLPVFRVHDNSRRARNASRTQLSTWWAAVNHTKRSYQRATSVLVYQHDPGG